MDRTVPARFFTGEIAMRHRDPPSCSKTAFNPLGPKGSLPLLFRFFSSNEQRTFRYRSHRPRRDGPEPCAEHRRPRFPHFRLQPHNREDRGIRQKESRHTRRTARGTDAGRLRRFDQTPAQNHHPGPSGQGDRRGHRRPCPPARQGRHHHRRRQRTVERHHPPRERSSGQGTALHRFRRVRR